ncbi:Copper-sensing transcriptional repressor CsoR, partial [Dysosmobacter welbionis]
PHGSRPQSKQVQTVPGDKAELIFDADGLVCPAGLPKPLDRNAILAEGLDHRQTVNVLNGRPGQRLLSPVAHRGGAGALAADPPQSKGG